MNSLESVPLADLLAEVARRRKKLSGMIDRIDASVAITTDSEAEKAIVAAAKAWRISTEAIVSQSRTARISEARMAVMTHLRGKGMSLQEVADVFGKDHGTVIHAIKTISARVKDDAEVAARMDAFASALS